MRILGFIFGCVLLVGATGCSVVDRALAPFSENLNQPEFDAEDVLLAKGMEVEFQDTISGVVANTTWNLMVTESRFPEVVTYQWQRGSVPNVQGARSGERTLTDLTDGRTLGPILSNEDSINTAETMPWLSEQVYMELLDTGFSAGISEGGLSVFGQTQRIDLEVTDSETRYVLDIDGTSYQVPILTLNNGQLVVLQNPKNPLVLSYEPIGIPLVTNFQGWRVNSIRYE